MQIVKMDYQVMLLSARSETNAMIRVNHARMISRIGFVAQDMKDLEDEFTSAIQDRVREIGSNECLENAQKSLEESAQSGGQVIVYSARQWRTLNDAISGRLIYIVLDELDFIVSLMETELLYLFSFFNSVTYIYELLYLYQAEIQIYFLLFDLFVDEVLIVMKSYDDTTNQFNRIIFKTLNEGVEEFRAAGSSIVDASRNC